jgi:hypothetical protein
MIEQVADTLHQIVSLFHLTQTLTIPRGEDDWVTVKIINLSEAAALSLALSFFLRQVGNRSKRLHPPRFQNLISVTLTKEN